MMRSGSEADAAVTKAPRPALPARGSCLCGAIRYEITGALGPIVMCHCAQCRKAQGGAFAVNAAIRAEDFTIIAGRNRLAAYESSPGKLRHFCRDCGSPIISTRTTVPGVVRVRIGTLDTPIDAGPQAHIFVASKAEWDAICDDLPQYAGREPARQDAKE
jgi:hypothetical protein